MTRTMSLALAAMFALGSGCAPSIEDFCADVEAGIQSPTADADADRLSNEFECDKANRLDPLSSDTDGDGLDDGVEYEGPTSPDGTTWSPTEWVNADSDDDDCPDGIEVRMGTDPNDWNDYPSDCNEVTE